MPEQVNRREKVKQVLSQATSCWESKDATSLGSLFAPCGCFTIAKKMHSREHIIDALNMQFMQHREIKLYVKRMIIDAEQMMGSVEAVVRTRSHTSPTYTESQVAWMIALVDDECLSIRHWQVWNDASNVALKNLDTPLPKEIWRPVAAPISPPTREKIQELLEEQINAYKMANIRMWKKCIHDDVILHPPWDVLIGRSTAKKAVSVFFENYNNTHITPLRLLYDETQPHSVAYQQIFKTSNIATGEVGEDIDFVFMEVADKKIRYWRTYFDTASSAQKCDKTFKQVFSQKTLASRAKEYPFSSPSSSSSPSPCSPTSLSLRRATL